MEWETAGASWESSEGPHTLSQHGGVQKPLFLAALLVVCQERVDSAQTEWRGSQRHVNAWLAPSCVLSLPPSVDDEGRRPTHPSRAEVELDPGSGLEVGDCVCLTSRHCMAQAGRYAPMSTLEPLLPNGLKAWEAEDMASHLIFIHRREAWSYHL